MKLSSAGNAISSVLASLIVLARDPLALTASGLRCYVTRAYMDVMIGPVRQARHVEIQTYYSMYFMKKGLGLWIFQCKLFSHKRRCKRKYVFFEKMFRMEEFYFLPSIEAYNLFKSQEFPLLRKRVKNKASLKKVCFTKYTQYIEMQN